MARVKGQLLGNVSGKIGDLIFKTTKSGGVVYKNKRIRKSSDSKADKDNKNRFSVVLAFTNAIHDSVLLKRTWSDFRNIKGKRAYDKIHSFISRDSYSDFIGHYAKILPEGSRCEITGFKHDSGNVEFTLQPYDDLVKLYKDPFSAVAIIYLNDPIEKRKGRKTFPHNAFIMVEEHFESLGINGLNSVSVKFENYENKFSDIDNYKRVRVYLSVFFNDVNGKSNWTLSSSFLYKGHEIDDTFYEEMKIRLRQERADSLKPQPKYRRLTRR